MFGQFSVKSDVFSFGVVLLEIVSGKKSNGCNQENPSICLIGQVSDGNFWGAIAETVS